MKNTSYLTDLGLTPAKVGALASDIRKKILSFLERWQAYEELLACLDAIDRPKLLTLQDYRARALLGLGRADEAMTVLQKRLKRAPSQAAMGLLGSGYLQIGEARRALVLVEEMGADGGKMPAFFHNLLGNIYRQLGDLDNAETAYLRYEKEAPNTREPLVKLMQLNQQRGNAMAAAAYAVQAFTVGQGQYPVTVPLLRELRDYFQETGDINHTQTAEDLLGKRLAKEIRNLKILLNKESEPALPSKVATPKPTTKIGHPRPNLDKIPVSSVEDAELRGAALELFGFDSLREAQREIMACTRRGEDVLAILPTGAGKSLCYQLPAFMDKYGTTLVISPLIALMKDQVDSLPPTVREQAVALNSSLDGKKLSKAIAGISAGKYRLVYAAPERLRQLPFVHAMQQVGVNRLVIDEAHCVSSWGHDFRPDYLWISQAHQDLGSPTILAMTATAPPVVRQDIEKRLFGQAMAINTLPVASQKSPNQPTIQLTNSPPNQPPLIRRYGRAPYRIKSAENSAKSPIQNPKSAIHNPPPMNRNLRQIVTDTFRENLMLSTVQAQNKGEKIQELLHLVQALPGSGIVYARSRKDCEEMAGMLRDQGVKAEHYHAGISERALVQDRFMRGDTRVIVATIAFGMGVDKSDIRFIIHFTLPSSLEAYYQEAGRAGRDGDKAHCILLYTYSDQSTLKRFVTQDALNVDYLRNLYRAVRQGLRGESAGILHLDTLRDTLKSDDTGVRVGLGTLEQAGLLQRHYDAPRTITLTRHTAGKCPPFDQMAEQASLRVGQTVTRNFLDLVAYSGIDVPDLEQNLLGWETDGHLTFSPRGREALLSLLPAPKDSSKRIDRLISQYNAMQQQKVAEIGSYGQTRKCRHGYLANYLGSQARTTCTSCDNCVGELIMPQTNDQLPALDKQKKWVLQTLREQSWGRSTLSKLLRGDKTAPERAWDSNFFGRLHFRTHSAITRLVDGLIDDGLLMENTLHHGGVTLEITDLGESFLRSGNLPVR